MATGWLVSGVGMARHRLSSRQWVLLVVVIFLVATGLLSLKVGLVGVAIL